MKRWLKISLKIIGGLLVLLIIVWCGAAYYINKNNETILAKILNQVNTKVNGTVRVAGMETTLLKGFPGISVSLKDVSLRDSLWGQHKKELLRAKDIDVSLNALSLIVGTINIRKVAINNASIYLYTDSTGYTNTSMFRTKDKKKAAENDDSSSDLEIRIIDLNKVDLVVDNQKRFKLFSFYVDELKGKIKYPAGRWDGNFKLKTQVRSFAFNTRKGSFLKDKTIAGNMTAHYDDEAEVIIIDQKPIKIGDDTFNIGANINIAEHKSAFSIAIKADQILYRNVAQILAPNISEKLFKFGIEKPMDVTASIIDNGDKNSADPLINVKMTVQNNKVSIPSGELTECSFTGYFSNQDTASKPIGDANSIIRFYGLKANYYNAPIKVDTFTVSNLEKPLAQGLITSKFDLEKLNKSFEEETFKFEKGTADLSLFCQADIDNFLFTKPVIHGKVVVKDANITYVPRNLKLVNSSLDLHFNQKDLNITNSRLQLGKSVLNMNCSIANFLNFYYTDPQKIEAKVNLSSPNLNLSEFMPFLGPRQARRKKTSSKNAIKEASEQLSAALEASKVHLQLNVKQAVYNKFVARNLNAKISLIGNGVYFNKIGVQHAGGYVNFSGKVEQLGAINKMQLKANIAKVSIKEFFHAFDNFGQQSITNKNLKGFLSANVNASGNVTSKGNMVPKSMHGKVNFTLDKAALVGFEPLEKVGKFVFRSRNLSNVELEKLNGTLILRGDKVDISPMKVNSTALNFDVKGVYGFNSGTNIALDIPLRDPKKSADIIDREERELARMKGIVLHLKAVDEDGEIKIRWNKKKDREK
ncbi:AsmA family protein [Pedobacter ureilyticus]|uniref:AsmA family protein n=1 Tax=Pedobacter ureilyticus TaxID=1393051 RepID=A0ABW9JA75_9SPHI|nr:AsmA family protein [Pedobacter helvus]